MEQLYARHGSLLGAVVIADTCREKELSELSATYYAKVMDYLNLESRLAEHSGWNRYWKSRVLTHRCMILSSSKYFCDDVVAHGNKQWDISGDETCWNATSLYMAQANAHIGKFDEVINLLKISFSGIDAGDIGLFMWPDGTVCKTENDQRKKLIQILKENSALNKSVVEDLKKVINPAMLDDEAFKIFGLTRDVPLKEADVEKGLDF